MNVFELYLSFLTLCGFLTRETEKNQIVVIAPAVQSNKLADRLSLLTSLTISDIEAISKSDVKIGGKHIMDALQIMKASNDGRYLTRAERAFIDSLSEVVMIVL